MFGRRNLESRSIKIMVKDLISERIRISQEEEFPQAYQLVLEEFNLPPDRTKPMYAIHWDIGMSWR